MTSAQYVGRIVRGPDGQPRLERPRITPAPRTDHPLVVPPHVWHMIANRRGFLARVFGKSMQPRILDNDVLVVTHRAPRGSDIVLVHEHGPHPIFGDVTASVWRYHARGFLTKDNPAYPEQRQITPQEIMGVVTRILPRERRHELEHHERIQELLALHQATGHAAPTDLGVYPDATRNVLSRVVHLPSSELVDGRLPWGLCRGTSIADHPHVGIHAGDTLTISLSPETHVGQLVIEQHEEQIFIGLLQREGLRGEFYIDVRDRRVYVTQAGLPITKSIGVVAHHE